jgi:hypothetical protein
MPPSEIERALARPNRRQLMKEREATQQLGHVDDGVRDVDDHQGLDLLPQHQAKLADSGVADGVAGARGYQSIDSRDLLDELGFAPITSPTPGLLIPLLGTDGEVVGYQYRPDHPVSDRNGHGRKYVNPTGQRMMLDVPPWIPEQLDDPGVPLIITEGPIKGDAAASKGLTCVSLLGVWCWLGQNSKGGKVALAEWRAIALNRRPVVLAFDSDILEKDIVREALLQLGGFLESRGARVCFARFPSGPDGEKVGLDDFLRDHSTDEFFGITEPLDNLTAELEGSSWKPRDLHPVLSGEIQRPRATILRRSDDACLFYRGRVSSLFGEAGEGKSWIALFACLQEVRKGCHVLYIDFEDSEAGVIERMLAIGAPVDLVAEFFHYISPDEPYGEAARGHVLDVIHAYEPTLVVIDSTGESMALDHVKTNLDEEVSAWNRRFPKKLSRLGPGVLLLDHVPKDPSNRAGPSGSHRKQDAVDGAAYLVEAKQEMGRGQMGAAKLVTRKDRLGNQVRGRLAAEFILDARTEFYKVVLDAPSTNSGEDGNFRPTVLMERASRTIEGVPGLSKNSIDEATTGNRGTLFLAVDTLVAEGYVEQSGYHYRSLKPYRQDEDPKLKDEA